MVATKNMGYKIGMVIRSRCIRMMIPLGASVLMDKVRFAEDSLRILVLFVHKACIH